MSDHSSDALHQDFALCRSVTRERARNFYYGLRLTPEPRRSALFAIYAWMRLGDDIADSHEPLDTRREQLHAFRSQTEHALASEIETPIPVNDNGSPQWAPAMWRSFEHCARTHQIAHADIHAMLDGLEEDLGHKGYETLDDLEGYCARVASSVGRVCVRIWGVRPGANIDDALALAHNRGLAFQLTNILRDFAQDFDDGRVYLPREMFQRHRLTPEQLRTWRDPQRCTLAVGEIATRARALYESSAALDSLVQVDCAPTLWAMTRIYSTLLARIERAPRLVADAQPARIRSLHKAGIAIRAVVRSRLAST